MSDDLKTEVAEVEPVTALDEEDIAAQEALEQELAELGDDDNVSDEPDKADETEPITAEHDLEAAQKGIEAALNELHEFFNYVPPAQSVEKPKAVETVAEKQQDKQPTAEIKLKELEAEMERVKIQLAEEQKAKQQAAHTREIYNKLQTFMDHSMAAARAQHADYDQATQYYVESRLAHFKALSDIYPESSTEQGALNYVHGELGELIAKCAKDKVNPAEKLYEIAHKLGYKKAEATEVQKKKSMSKADIDNVRRIDFAQKATKTLASTNGINDIESDVPMSDEEYDEWIQDPENQALMKKKMQMVSY